MANKLIETARSINTRILNGIRVKPNRGKSSEVDISVDSELASILTDSESTLRDLANIVKFREMSSNRNEQYDAFDEMEKDSVIAAALKMYADDATQYNLDGDVVWVESSDPNIAAFGNRLIKVLKINEKAWMHIYNLVKYGDIYLETFYDDELQSGMSNSPISGSYGTSVLSHKNGSRIEEYVEMVNNPAIIFDLKQRGKTQGYLKIDENRVNPQSDHKYSLQLTGTSQYILPADKYIHIMLGGASNRYPETFDITIEDPSSESGVTTQSYVVEKGKSLLEDVFKTFREVSLMEDSILLNRVTRTSITRILQVEVGDMPKQQVREKLRQLKIMIEQRNFMDKNSGTFSSQAAPGPVDNIIYVPTRNGSGAIQMQAIGGDVDPKSLIDIEYYQQKEAGGLGIPLSYLKAQSGDGGGLSSGTALTKLDNRYARAIKRIQIAYTQGIQTLLNVFAIRKGLPDYVNNFKVRMLSPSTIEDNDRDEQLNNRVGMLRDMIDIFSSDDRYSEDTVKDIISYMTSTFLNKPEVSKILDSDADISEDVNMDESEELDKNGDLDTFTAFDNHEDIERPSESDMNFDNLASSDIDLPTETDSVPDENAETNDFGNFEEFAQ